MKEIKTGNQTGEIQVTKRIPDIPINCVESNLDDLLFQNDNSRCICP